MAAASSLDQVSGTAFGAPRWYTHPLNRESWYRGGALALGALPRPLFLRLAARLAVRLQHRFPGELAAVAANVDRVMGGTPAPARAAAVTRVFQHFAMCFCDLLVTNRRRRPLDRLLAAVEGAAGLEAAADGGRGVVVLTAHLGNWELAGRLLAGRVARPIHVVVAPEVDPGVERFLRGGPAPVRFVTQGSPTVALGLLAALRRGEVVAMQGDRPLGRRGDAWVPFFGVPAAFPLGPFLLARAAGVAVVPVFCVLGPDRRYTIRVGAPIAVARDAEEEALGRWVTVLEGAVRRHPEQWFNFFDFWGSGAAD